MKWIPTSTNCYPDLEFTSTYLEQSENVIIQLKTGKIEIGWLEFYISNGYRKWCTNCEWYNLNDVVAWMPMPVPYRGV